MQIQCMCNVRAVDSRSKPNDVPEANPPGVEHSKAAELARLAKVGDVDALVELVETHYDMMFRVAVRWLGNREDAEDVTQQVAMKLQDALARYDERNAFRGWLYRVTINAALDFQRGKARRSGLVEAYALVHPDRARATQEDQLATEALWRSVRELPDKQRDAVLLVYGEELSHAEAAEIMGVKETTVSWHISNARKALRNKL